MARASNRWLTTAWSTIVPSLCLVAVLLAWRMVPSTAVVILLTGVLAAAILVAVHHAEVIALRVGEPFGSLVLAIAVTIIEVAPIVVIMLGGGDQVQTLARDTVFAAVMITLNGIVGLAILAGAWRSHVVFFNAEGAGSALASIATLATLSLVLPTFTTSAPGPQFSPGQLAFAGTAALLLYGLFVAVQTGRHRDYFLPVDSNGEPAPDVHAQRPTSQRAAVSLAFLVVALAGVVGAAKLVSPAIEKSVIRAGFPLAVVGVMIALMILLPETLAAVRAARRGRLQTSINLAFGSAMASIGLTIPAIAVTSIWLPGPLHLGLGGTHLVLLAITIAVTTLTVVPGRATLLQAGVHLTLLSAFLFLAFRP